MSSDNKGRTFGLLLFGILVSCLAVNVASGAVKAVQSERWPRASATITRANVDRDGSDVTTRFTPDVEYSYELNGGHYQAKRIHFLAAPIYQDDQASRAVAPYAVGKTVQVAYNPVNPSESVLEPGLPAGFRMQAGATMFLMGIAGYIFFEIRNPERRVLLRTFYEDGLETAKEEERAA